MILRAGFWFFVATGLLSGARGRVHAVVMCFCVTRALRSVGLHVGVRDLCPLLGSTGCGSAWRAWCELWATLGGLRMDTVHERGARKATCPAVTRRSRPYTLLPSLTATWAACESPLTPVSQHLPSTGKAGFVPRVIACAIGCPSRPCFPGDAPPALFPSSPMYAVSSVSIASFAVTSAIFPFTFTFFPRSHDNMLNRNDPLRVLHKIWLANPPGRVYRRAHFCNLFLRGSECLVGS